MRPGPLAAVSALAAVAIALVAFVPWEPPLPNDSPVEPGVQETSVTAAERLSAPTRTASSTQPSPVERAATDEDDATPTADSSERRALSGVTPPIDETTALLDVHVVLERHEQPAVPQAGIRVWFQREGESEDTARVLGRTDAEGHLRRAIARAGGARVWLEVSDLPEGVVKSLETRALEKNWPFLRAGESTLVERPLVESRSLTGVVFDHEGGTLRLMRLELLSLSTGRSEVHSNQNAFDAHDPTFQVRGIPADRYIVRSGDHKPLRGIASHLHEGGFSTDRSAAGGLTSSGIAISGWSNGSSGTDLRAPNRTYPEVYVDLRAASAEGVVLAFGTRDLVLTGRVVDGEGEPVEGAKVTLVETRVPGGPWNAATPLADLERDGWRGSAASGADGSFDLVDVPRNAIRMEVAAPDVHRVRTAVFGAASLAPIVIELDFVGSLKARADLGEFVVETVRPFEASGTVRVLDRAGAAEDDELLFDARFPVGSSPTVDLAGKERPYSSFNAETGAFLVRCNTPRDVVEVAVFWRSRPHAAKIYKFHPAPNETAEGVVLEFP